MPQEMQQNDHDLLITLHVEVKGIRDDIKDLKDDTKGKVEDHERRLRKLEKLGALLAGGLILLQFLTPYIKGLFK